MPTIPHRFLLTVVLVTAVVAARADEPVAPAPAGAETANNAPAAADDGKPAAPASPAARPPPPTQQRFTPSEKVRADFPVSFPTDI